MQPEEVQQVVLALRQQLAELVGGVENERKARVAAFEQDKPQLRQLITALEGSRAVLEQELKQLQTQPAGARAAVKKTTQVQWALCAQCCASLVKHPCI